MFRSHKGKSGKECRFAANSPREHFSVCEAEKENVDT